MGLTREHIPLYFQLQQELRKKILSKAIPKDQPLPTESELCKEYNVSRTTVRQAFAALKNEGLIFRIPGKGTFLTKQKPDNKVLHYFNTSGSLVQSFDFAKLKKKIHHKGLVSPPFRASLLMNLEPGEKVFCVRGIRIQDDYPLCYFITTVLSEYAGILAGEAIKNEPVLTTLEKKTGMTLQKMRQKITAVRADERMAKFLGIKKDEPLLMLECVYFVEDEKVVEVGFNYFNAERYHYSMELSQKR